MCAFPIAPVPTHMKVSSVFAEHGSRSRCGLQEGQCKAPSPPGHSQGQQVGEAHVDTHLLFVATKKYT